MKSLKSLSLLCLLFSLLAILPLVGCDTPSETPKKCNHQFGAWSISKEADCVADGMQSRSCELCGFSEQSTLPATGHSVEIDPAVKATCTAPGLTEGSHCGICGTVLSAQETTEPTGHTEVVDKAAVAPTCTEDGSTESVKCAVCESVLRESRQISATGHTVVIDRQAKDATCTTAGSTESSHCSVCSTVISAEKTIPATGHRSVTDKAVSATCTSAGKTQGSHCSVCNATIKAQTDIPAKEHTVVTDKAVSATCTSTGKTEGSHCSVCNKTLKAQTTVSKKAHNYVEGICSSCGAKDPNYVTTSVRNYLSYPNIPDFGSMFPTYLSPTVWTGGDASGVMYLYSESDVYAAGGSTDAANEYIKLLKSKGFTFYTSFYDDDGDLVNAYTSSKTAYVVTVSVKDLSYSEEGIFVGILLV